MREDSKNRLLIIDDDKEMVNLLVDYLSKEGYSCLGISNPQIAADLISKEACDVVISDLIMEGKDGFTLLEEIKEIEPDIPFIIITAFGSLDTAIEAMKKGAYYFLAKPIKLESLKILIKKAIEERRLRQEHKLLLKEVERKFQFNNIIGKSKAMQEVFKLIELVAPTSINVLVLGDSGTGKELVARAIHYNSPRKKNPFIAINCSALPDNLLESELFGYIRGAFTGAVTNKKGLFEVADKGTLFLDEIGNMSLNLQAKLLRVIEDKEIRPLGSVQNRRVDVRIIAATNKKLEEEVEKGNFREDLYYRINVIAIYLPPLKERPEDIPFLAQHFLEKYSYENKKAIKGFDDEAMRALLSYEWKGNVRELENFIERAVLLCKRNRITVSELNLKGTKRNDTFMESIINKCPTLEELEDYYIRKVLKSVNGDKQEAAKILGISVRTLYRWEKRWNNAQ